jgi:putative ABC transport system permease protein
MIKNYLKTAFRNLLRNSSNTFINILGLSIGIAACLLIFILLRFENSFDNFHKNKERIYRVVSVFHNPDGLSYSAGIPFPLTSAMRQDYPELQKVAGIFETDGLITIPDGKNKNEKFEEEKGIFYAEPQFFRFWLAVG